MLPESRYNTFPPPLLAELTRLRNAIIQDSQSFSCHQPSLRQTPQVTKSIHNFGHYLALRKYDLRQLQDRLAAMGLSSLSHCESHVLATLNQVISLLAQRQKHPRNYQLSTDVPSFEEGQQFLEENTNKLFGLKSEHRNTRIMVTLPSEAAHEKELVNALLENGMNVARINCAHDSEASWKAMIQHVRTQAEALGRPCRIMMDLAGEKIRTGPVAQLPGVIRIRVKRNAYGIVTRPTFFELYTAEQYPAGLPQYDDSQRHSIPISQTLFQQIQSGDRIVLQDARGKQRHIVLHAQPEPHLWLASTTQSIYLTAGIRLQLQRKARRWHIIAKGELAQVNTQDEIIRLHLGDKLRLTSALKPAQPAVVDIDGSILKAAQISCTQPEALKQVQIGQSVWIDDGKLGCIVESINKDDLLLKVTHAPKRGLRLKADKGINFPQTELKLSALTPKDQQDLAFICQHADIVGLSFTQSADDIETLIAALQQHQASHLAIIAKIETKQGIRNLPDIILQALGRRQFGVMIARGDLAVELGGERLVEMQEELLWLCESAHVPVIWATQVLETLAKDGILTRPELTDAAMSARAECVMLNKGPHITRAVKTLDNILTRMESHQHKKGARLRNLHQWS